LGLEALREAVSRFLRSRNAVVVAEYTETESGRKSNRPVLLAAMETCRKKRATLVIAKLDRLSRSVAFISRLLDSGVAFLAADQPTKNRFMLHIQAAFTKEESRKI
jgi:DNA invertase Pin-like site-specific DNA recombinase